MPGPLSHIRVLELSRVLAGPWAAQNLADLGAEVIKIERPGIGDDTRKWGPPFLKDEAGAETAETAYYLSANRGKKSVTVDLATLRGQELVRLLARQCDVVIENFRVGGSARFGLDYESLAPTNPGLVYCSITGFGQDGPYKDRGGYDYIIQAMGGLMSITGERDDKGGGPQKVGLAISDLFTGMYATVAINAALVHRERTGAGQYIDLALLDSTAAMLSMMATNYFASGTAPGRMGHAHPNVAPYQLFETADKPIVVAIGNDGQFARLCAAIGEPALAQDPRFSTNADRVANRDALAQVLATALGRRSGTEWLAAFAEAIIPCGPVNSIAQVFDDPQIRHRGMKVELPHATAGTVAQSGSPMRLSATPVSYTHAAPVLGEHTDQVLADRLGMSADAIEALRADGVI
ncbi:MAG: CaiB/BaiF CoA-transferase family protein [Alphaproteobacteria bacterium]|nr:CaiB/BaiF CoA-transferase family protein [Alphaproteobacteria bacterium]